MTSFLFILNWIPFLFSLLFFAYKNWVGSFSFVLFESFLGLTVLRFELVFDTLSTTMLLMITLLSGVVGQYSYFYLDRQKRKNYFFSNFIGVVLSVVLMIVTSNLVFILLSWILTSIFLSRCLLYNKERLQARLAVKKKFWISRIGDLSLLSSILIFWSVFKSTDIKVLSELSSVSGSFNIQQANLAVFFLCLSCLVKAVQFPFHLWLPETMETPAPVSALMHAGVVNAGGFLLIRSSLLLTNLPNSLFFIAFVGALSAAFGSLVMLTQNDIKKKLAYSTVSQMGMMIFACGIGAFSIAMIHIIAHSLYKAYAFLSTGKLIEESRTKSFEAKIWTNLDLSLSFFVSFVLVVSGFFFYEGKLLALFLYSSVLVLGFLQCLNVKYNKLPLSFGVLVRLSLLFCLGLFIYILSEIYLVKQSIDFVGVADLSNNFILQLSLSLLVPIFWISFWVSQKMMQNKFNFHQNIYFFLLNGAYLGQLTGRIFKTKTKELKNA